MKKLFILLILSFQLFATNTFVIDVRTDDEFNSGHVESAINIEWQDIVSVANMIDEDDQVFSELLSVWKSLSLWEWL